MSNLVSWSSTIKARGEIFEIHLSSDTLEISWYPTYIVNKYSYVIFNEDNGCYTMDGLYDFDRGCNEVFTKLLFNEKSLVFVADEKIYGNDVFEFHLVSPTSEKSWYYHIQPREDGSVLFNGNGSCYTPKSGFTSGIMCNNLLINQLSKGFRFVIDGDVKYDYDNICEIYFVDQHDNILGGKSESSSTEWYENPWIDATLGAVAGFVLGIMSFFFIKKCFFKNSNNNVYKKFTASFLNQVVGTEISEEERTIPEQQNIASYIQSTNQWFQARYPKSFEMFVTQSQKLLKRSMFDVPLDSCSILNSEDVQRDAAFQRSGGSLNESSPEISPTKVNYNTMHYALLGQNPLIDTADDCFV